MTQLVFEVRIIGFNQKQVERIVVVVVGFFTEECEGEIEKLADSESNKAAVIIVEWEQARRMLSKSCKRETKRNKRRKAKKSANKIIRRISKQCV